MSTMYYVYIHMILCVKSITYVTEDIRNQNKIKDILNHTKNALKYNLSCSASLQAINISSRGLLDDMRYVRKPEMNIQCGGYEEADIDICSGRYGKVKNAFMQQDEKWKTTMYLCLKMALKYNAMWCIWVIPNSNINQATNGLLKLLDFLWMHIPKTIRYHAETFKRLQPVDWQSSDVTPSNFHT